MTRRIALFTVLAGLLVTGMALGQKKKDEDRNTRSVQGTVTDGGNSPLTGAVVQLKDTKSLQVRSFITKEDGTYHFHGLNTDIDYELKSDFQGNSSGAKTLSSFDSRKTAVINFKLEVRK